MRRAADMRGLVLRAFVLTSLVVLGFRGEASADSGLLTALSAPLAPGAKLQIRNVVLEDGSEITLDLARFEPFTADAKLVSTVLPGTPRHLSHLIRTSWGRSRAISSHWPSSRAEPARAG